VMLDYVVQITRDATRISPADHERLRAVGFDDKGILQITLIASWFNYINRVADALGVDQTTATRTLALIKKAGYATDTVGDDRRQRHWALRPEGKALLRKLKPRWEAAQEAFEKRLGPAQAVALKDASYRAASKLFSTQTVHP